MISRLLNQIFYFYYILLVIRIFLTWLPNIDFSVQPYKILDSLTSPFLNVFRGIIPPIGGVIDISPIIAFIVLQLLQGIIVPFVSGLGL